jgi:hypothetical protein
MRLARSEHPQFDPRKRVELRHFSPDTGVRSEVPDVFHEEGVKSGGTSVPCNGYKLYLGG